MEKQNILIVDDTPENIDILVAILRSEYELKVATNGARALKLAVLQPKPDMILLDIMMPGIDGYEVCQRLKSDPATSDIPIIFVTAKGDSGDEELGFDLGAVDYITKPVNPSIVRARVKTQLAIHDQKRVLEEQVNIRTKELDETRLKIIQRLGRAVEYKDNETGLHVIRMSHYSRLIAQTYGGNDAWVDMMFNGAAMHDVGKIGIPDYILTKPAKLNKEEWDIMQKHTLFGAEIIGDDNNPLLKISRAIALTHHEKWDGSGYPHGLKGEEIPLEGRVVAIADVFDALTSVRPYKKAWSVTDALAFLDAGRGAHFDPALVPLFMDVLPEILTIKKEFSD